MSNKTFIFTAVMILFAGCTIRVSGNLTTLLQDVMASVKQMLS